MQFRNVAHEGRAGPSCHPRRRRLPILATPTLLLAAAWGPLYAPAEPPEKQKLQAVKAETLDARAIVEALANRNPAPALVVGDWLPDPLFAKNYDWPEDARAWKAFDALADHAGDAWHEMVAHLDDGRYCLTYDTVNISSTKGYPVVMTIGDACREIIARSLVDVYLRHLKLDKPTYWRMQIPDVTHDRRKLKAWCEARSTKCLYEMQIEFCERAIAELEKGEFTFAVTPPTRAEWVAAVKSEIESLRASKKAFHFHGFGESMVHYTRSKADEFRRKYAASNDHAAGEQ
jgi:hypothetical protein